MPERVSSNDGLGIIAFWWNRNFVDADVTSMTQCYELKEELFVSMFVCQVMDLRRGSLAAAFALSG